MKKLRFAVLVTVALVLGACSSPPPKTTSTVLMPAKAEEATRLRNVAVLRFDITSGTDITPEVESVIASVRVNGRPYFRLVERARINEAFRELRLVERAAVDASVASKLGKLVSANGLYMGVVTKDGVQDQYYQETRSDCVQYEQKKDKKGNSYDGRCLRFNNRQVQCIRRVASFEFVPKLLDVSTAEVTYSRTITGSSEHKSCPDAGTPLKSADELRTQSRQAALRQFREDVAPFERSVDIRLLNITDGLTPGGRVRFSGALEFAQANRMDRACEIWRDLLSQESTSPSIMYNLGTCAETRGNLPEAFDWYSRADKLLPRPDNIVNEGLSRVRILIDNSERARSQTRTK